MTVIEIRDETLSWARALRVQGATLVDAVYAGVKKLGLPPFGYRKLTRTGAISYEIQWMDRVVHFNVIAR